MSSEGQTASDFGSPPRSEAASTTAGSDSTTSSLGVHLERLALAGPTQLSSVGGGTHEVLRIAEEAEAQLGDNHALWSEFEIATCALSLRGYEHDPFVNTQPQGSSYGPRRGVPLFMRLRSASLTGHTRLTFLGRNREDEEVWAADPPYEGNHARSFSHLVTLVIPPKSRSTFCSDEARAEAETLLPVVDNPRKFVRHAMLMRRALRSADSAHIER